jgi:hypothetical protein
MHKSHDALLELDLRIRLVVQHPYYDNIHLTGHRDKYTAIHNLLQAGVTIVENLGITNTEETPKDIIRLLQFISQKLTTTNPTHDTKAIEKHLDTLSQQIESLTKVIPPPNQNRIVHCGEWCPSAFNSFELPSWMLYQDVQLLWDSGLVRGESGYSLQSVSSILAGDVV